MNKLVFTTVFAFSALIGCSAPKTNQGEDNSMEVNGDVQEKLEVQKKFVEDSFQRATSLKNLNAFISLNSIGDVDLKTTGSLAGMTLAVKDNIHVKGLPNSAGTSGLAEFVPTNDAPIIERLRNKGALVIGKANMHELAFGITSINTYSGPVRNPYDTTRFAGGSSGGSAAAIAARIVRAAIGTDTGGSVRLPAALCGIIGFRPTIGRYPTSGVTPVSSTRDTPGPMALTMEDITLLDSVMAGRPQVTVRRELSNIRLGVSRDTFFRNLDPETDRVMQAALEKLQQAGVTLVEIETPNIFELNEKVSFPVALYEGTADMEKYLATYDIGKDFFEVAAATKSADVRGLYTEMAKDADGDGRPDGIIPEEVYQAAVNIYRPKLQAAYQEAFQSNSIDALVFPTTILPAGPIEGSVETVLHNGQRLPTFQTYIQNTDPGSNAGIPGISLPIGLTREGLPVGLELDGAEGSDEDLLAIALAIEPLFGQLPAPQIIQK